jgi:hypothetical protein
VRVGSRTVRSKQRAGCRREPNAGYRGVPGEPALRHPAPAAGSPGRRGHQPVACSRLGGRAVASDVVPRSWGLG